jgi:hypothetical protein
MNEEEYPSNSKFSRPKPSVPVDPPKPSSTEERPKVEKAIEGEAVIKRRSIGKRLATIFTGVSLREVVDDAIDQAIIPGIKGLLLSAGERALDKAFGNGAGGRSIPNAAARTMVTNVAHVAYNKFSAPNAATVRPGPAPTQGPMVMSRRGQAVHDFEEIEFQNRGDASIILNLMYDRLQEYGSVSVAEFYGWADIRGNFTDQNWGWKDLTGAGPTRNNRTGMWTLNLPMPVDLNR